MHGEIGDAERGDIRKVMHGIIEQRHAAADDAAKNFGHHQSDGENHGPAKNRRLQRGMSMPGAAMLVRRCGMAVTVIVAMAVRMPGHDPILRASQRVRPSGALIRHFDTVPAGMD